MFEEEISDGFQNGERAGGVEGGGAEGRQPPPGGLVTPLILGGKKIVLQCLVFFLRFVLRYDPKNLIIFGGDFVAECICRDLRSALALHGIQIWLCTRKLFSLWLCQRICFW